MEKKILITLSETTQVIPLLDKIKSDSFFIEGINYDILYGRITNEELSKYKVIISHVNPKFITGEEYTLKNKQKGQIMFQMTHGVWVKKPNNYLYKNGNDESGTIDFILSPNKYSTKLFLKMGYSENEILNFGYPRLEYYSKLNKIEIINKIKREIPDFDNYKKIILFAPTWIRHNEKIHYSLNKILDQLKNNSLLLVSQHNLSLEEEVIYTYKKRKKKHVHVFGPNSELRGEHLMKISDSLFTDYSSIIFDFATLNGWKKSHYYCPIEDLEQDEITREIYRKKFFEWGKGIVNFNRDDNKDDMIFYNANDVESSSISIIEKLKEWLK